MAVEGEVKIFFRRRGGAALEAGAELQHGVEALQVEGGIAGEAMHRIGGRRMDFRGDVGRDVQALGCEPDRLGPVCRIERPAQTLDPAAR